MDVSIFTNNDEKSFLWSILASLHPVQRQLNMPGIQYPVEIKDISKLEQWNYITVNVYGYENKKIFPLHITALTTTERHYVNLLHITADETSHYVLVNNLRRLVWGNILITKAKHIFVNIVKLHGAQRIKLPEADNKKGRDKVRFTKTEHELRLPFIIYADFESVLWKEDSCEPSSSKFFTTQYQHHIPCGSCIYMKCSMGDTLKHPQVNIGDDATENFLDQVLVAATICRQHLANKIPMKRLTQ